MNSKWKNYGLWVSLTAAVLIAVQAVGALFGFELTTDQNDGIMAAVYGVLGVLVVLGIVSNPEAGKGYPDNNKDKNQE